VTVRRVGRDDVTQIGYSFTVSKNGKELDSFMVRNGYVVQMTELFSELLGRNAPTLTQSFGDIDRAPKIVVANPTEVVSLKSPRTAAHSDRLTA